MKWSTILVAVTAGQDSWLSVDGGILDKVVGVYRRETATTPASTNSTTWDSQVKAACLSAMSTLTVTNPSGMAACYNIASMENSTGIFQADLRLYKVVDAAGSFAGVPDDNVMVSLNYDAASISEISPTDLTRRRVKRDASGITLMQRYAFVGQVDESVMSSSPNNSGLQTVLLPSVHLTVNDTSGPSINTTLADDMAAYVTGVFSDDAVTQHSTSTTNAAVTVVPPFNIPSSTIFVVPGVNIMLFPIGAVITGIWTILFCATVGYGTVGRIGFRDSFKRNAQRRYDTAATI